MNKEGSLDWNGIYPPMAPFPWFGGKSKVAHVVWRAFGPIQNYIEPFFGSGAVLLGSPYIPTYEVVNDLDGFICNFWRALQFDPDAVTRYAEWPINECDLHARHLWLVSQKVELSARLMGNPDFFDAKIAGYWVWGIGCWIGGGFCSGDGPWQSVDGVFVKSNSNGDKQGIHKLGVNKKRPHLSYKKGIHKLGVTNDSEYLKNWMQALANRLEKVRVCCGDWRRITGTSVRTAGSPCGIFLDPPYSQEIRAKSIYAEDEIDVAKEVRDWAVEHGDDKDLRIALCGYEGEHDIPETWTKYTWQAVNGYGRTEQCVANRGLERIWFSPHCLPIEERQISLF